MNAEEQSQFVHSFAQRAIGNFVGGAWTPTAGSVDVEVSNPSTGEVIGKIPDSTDSDVDSAVRSAREAQPAWGRIAPAARSQRLMALADLVEEHAEEFIALECSDVGKPVSTVRSDEVHAWLDWMRFFAGAARILNAPAGQDYVEGTSSVLRREPLGVVGGITPWNYPLLQAIAKALPALATGNTVVMKPAESTPYSTARFAELAAEVLPPGVFNVVLGTGRVTGEALSSHPDIDMVSFTGSIDVGRAVGAIAAQGVKKSVMELGGNSAVLVFADADLETALDRITPAGISNTGQDCMAASRLIVHSSIKQQVVDGLIARLAGVVIGDALDETTTMGPVASKAQLDRLVKMVSNLPAGAQIAVGGHEIDRPGCFFEPTVIHGVGQEDEIVQEEVFGPLFTVQSFETVDEAIEMANGTRYGLAAAVFTTDLNTAMRTQNALNFGSVWINTHLEMNVDTPVSGFGASGVGSENGEIGILEFTRLKHIVVRYN